MPELEMTIAKELIERALARGYTVSVYDGEEFTVKRSVDLATIIASLATTDCDTLVIRNGKDRLGSILLIWGNGEDVISDYTDKPEIEALVA